MRQFIDAQSSMRQVNVQRSTNSDMRVARSRLTQRYCNTLTAEQGHAERLL